MKTRTLKDLSKVTETKQDTKLTIETKCPKKWAFVDMETGDIWVYFGRKYKKYAYTYVRADKNALEMVKRIADDGLIYDL